MRVETWGFFESEKITGLGDRRVDLRMHSLLEKFSIPLGGADVSSGTHETQNPSCQFRSVPQTSVLT